MDGPQFDVHADASWKHSVLFRLSFIYEASRLPHVTTLDKSLRSLNVYDSTELEMYTILIKMYKN